eukprot:9209223-Pyramimonas_sp.AAC.1
MKRTPTKGIEQLGKKVLVWLPEQGKLELVQLFQIEKEVAWPWQLTVVLVALTRKPFGRRQGHRGSVQASEAVAKLP